MDNGWNRYTQEKAVSQKRIKEKDNKVLVIIISDAIGDPRAVVIIAYYTAEKGRQGLHGVGFQSEANCLMQQEQKTYASHLLHMVQWCVRSGFNALHFAQNRRAPFES